MHIETEIKLGFKNVLIKPKHSTVSSRAKVDLCREYVFKHSRHNWAGIPIFAANMDTIGTFNMAKVLYKHKLITAIHKYYDIAAWQEFLNQESTDAYNHIVVSCGILTKDYQYLQEILTVFPQLKFICVDVANGYTEDFLKYIAKVRKHFPTKTIIAGNVVTAEMVEKVILAGADIVKVGIGPGSVCTTRVKTGVGYPQLSAIIECADAAHGLGGHIVADGGCTCAGDLAKAFGAGADFVMLGGMLAGHDECEGEIVEIDDAKYMKFYGMSSSLAMEKYHEGVAKYRTSEGKIINVPYRGPVEATILDMLGGLRSACTYVGAVRLKELARRTTFIMVKEQENMVFC